MDEVEQALSVRQVEGDPGRGVWQLEDGAGEVVAVIATVAGPSDVCTVLIDVAQPLVVGRAQAQQLVRVVIGLRGTDFSKQLEASIRDPLVRYEARRAGFSGGLRDRLVRAPSARVRAHDRSAPDALLSELEALLPSVDVALRRRRIRHYEIAARSHDRSGEIRLRIEDRPGMMVEQVASVIDTTLAVKRRFGTIASTVRRIDFDLAGYGPRTRRKWAGLARGGIGIAWLNPDLVFVDALVESRRQRLATGGRPRSARVPPQYNEIDGVTAHELWHLIDRQVIGSGRQYVEFNRALGEGLGVATLEHALRGTERGALPEWRVAHERLTREVSPYATTNPAEATAEMFKLWWCSNGHPTGIVATFGDLIEQYVQGR